MLHVSDCPVYCRTISHQRYGEIISRLVQLPENCAASSRTLEKLPGPTLLHISVESPQYNVLPTLLFIYDAYKLRVALSGNKYSV
jgi:hypothetical protein